MYMEFAHIRRRYIKDVHIRKICTCREVRDIQKICAYLPYMRNFCICTYFPYMHNFRVWNLYISSFMYLHHICANSIYRNSAYTEIVHIRKVCAYLLYIPNFPICEYLPYMHVVYVSASYMQKFHIDKLYIYENCAYMEDMRLSSVFVQFPYMRNFCILNLCIYDADT